ncbi:hypothetical protein AAFF_G00171610 [Aldrovandia affinis]|uniref:Uncharacterized protein n=1 Tax=Aldrovandia affinis TaxID=143900 RepID=A0AAD7SYL9_9TELE|nr:hypothetical protein AAFF_G00171610 [Aldrovandia affinis]
MYAAAVALALLVLARPGFMVSRPVRLPGAVTLHVLHVNTVGNQQFSGKIFSKDLRKYARTQSNTTKTLVVSRLRFVSDKRRLCSQHGHKNTCIEFTANVRRSANYTSNATHSLQPCFRSMFETVSQGRAVMSTKPFTVSNTNLMCYLYGVANLATVVVMMKTKKEHFHSPLFFSSVNVSGNGSYQIFPSMSINSQNVTDAERQLTKALAKVASLVELHVHLNALCCLLAQEHRGMLPFWDKLCLANFYQTKIQNSISKPRRMERMDRVPPEHVEPEASSDLDGDWHFLTLHTGQVFGFMKMVPGSRDATLGMARFCLPRNVGAMVDTGAADAPSGDRSITPVRCPICSARVPRGAFWRHAVIEISCKNIELMATETTSFSGCRWVLPEDDGWTEPIYRSRQLNDTHAAAEALRNATQRFGTRESYSDKLAGCGVSLAALV